MQLNIVKELTRYTRKNPLNVEWGNKENTYKSYRKQNRRYKSKNIDNNSTCECIKQSNQKIQIVRLDLGKKNYNSIDSKIW